MNAIMAHVSLHIFIALLKRSSGKSSGKKQLRFGKKAILYHSFAMNFLAKRLPMSAGDLRLVNV